MRSILIVLLLATPAFSQEFFAVGEGLCWRATNSDFQNHFAPTLGMDHNWDAGFRAGLGIQHPWGWKASWTYTWFAEDDSRLWTDLANVGDVASYGDLDYQVHDFELGRVFCLHPTLQLEPFVGFRWGQVDYSVQDAMSGSGGNSMTLHSMTDSYGARLGLKGRCFLSHGFSLIGHGAMTGLFSTTENRGALESPASSWDVTDDHENHGVDAAAGVAWEWGLIEVSGGYEWNWWADIIQRRSAMGQPDYEDLLLEGAFLRVTGKY